MFYFIYGTDQEKRETKFISLLASLVAKPGATLFRLEGENYDEAEFEELVFGRSLFAKKYIVGSRNLLGFEPARNFLTSQIKALAESDNIFIMVEEKVPADLKKQIDLWAEKVLRFDRVKEKSVSGFNIFHLGDTLGARDRQKLWLVFTQAIRNGVLPEEIYWQYERLVRNMLAVAKTDQITSLKLHPFVLNKTQKYLKNFSTDELVDMHHRLTGLYHQVRAGRREMTIALERFILEV